MSQATVVAIGVSLEGERQILGVDVGASEDRGFWTAFLRELVKRGLAGVRLVISDAHEGLKQAIGTVLGGAAWERCRVHPYRQTRGRPEPLRQTRFVLDAHLGRLAGLLRLTGFDTLYRRDCGDAELAATAAAERRILLSRDQNLLKRRIVTHGYFVRSTDPAQQLAEVVRRFDLPRAARPFTRCMMCNGELAVVGREEVGERVPPRSRRLYSHYRRCAGCGRVHWKGTHYVRLRALVARALERDID